MPSDPSLLLKVGKQTFLTKVEGWRLIGRGRGEGWKLVGREDGWRLVGRGRAWKVERWFPDN